MSLGLGLALPMIRGGAGGGAVDVGPILEAMLNYWDLDETDDGSTTTPRVDSHAEGVDWTLTEANPAAVAATGEGLRGPGSIAARTFVSGGYLVAPTSVIRFGPTENYTVAGWVSPQTEGAGSTQTMFRIAQNSFVAAAIELWFGVNNTGTPGSPYNYFALSAGVGDFGYGNSVNIEAAVDGTFDFVQIQRDHDNDLLRMRINDGEWVSVERTESNRTTSTKPMFGFSEGAGDFGGGRFNYWGVYSGLLSDGELDYLYNSGQGRTYAEIVAAA